MTRIIGDGPLSEPAISASPRRVYKAFASVGIELDPNWIDMSGAGFKLSVLERREGRPFVVGSIIVTELPGHLYGDDPDTMWLHASMAYVLGRDVPTYAELVTLKAAVFGPKRYAYQVFPSDEDHVNYHMNALHLYGRRDGARVLPDFRIAGLI